MKVGGDNPDLAVSEQFCLARSFAIDNGEDLIANFEGVTQADIEQQCAAFEPLLVQIVSKAGQHNRV